MIERRQALEDEVARLRKRLHGNYTITPGAYRVIKELRDAAAEIAGQKYDDRGGYTRLKAAITAYDALHLTRRTTPAGTTEEDD